MGKFRSALFSFAFFPKFDEAIAHLADKLADKERWDFTDTQDRKNAILKNYLEFTFRKLRHEKKISFNPDLALVVHKLNDKTYTARTCLTLKMAYNNARLIVKPQSNWLRP